eukprot:TRINITY_DN25216_c0_g1_i1.p1 TRINITY_DN25216_c0_g1~~TRINITY_DN25216_c0_g1_i1.p1  ORF type:complete len:223 (-),score=46.67 TRINITY_DN25216_c0_g1_i1:95-763(-)
MLGVVTMSLAMPVGRLFVKWAIQSALPFVNCLPSSWLDNAVDGAIGSVFPSNDLKAKVVNKATYVLFNALQGGKIVIKLLDYCKYFSTSVPQNEEQHVTIWKKPSKSDSNLFNLIEDYDPTHRTELLCKEFENSVVLLEISHQEAQQLDLKSENCIELNTEQFHQFIKHGMDNDKENKMHYQHILEVFEDCTIKKYGSFQDMVISDSYNPNSEEKWEEINIL